MDCFRNLNRIEYIVTMACTGRCIHCSEGNHATCGEHINGDMVMDMMTSLCRRYKIDSVMTFGGEALLYSDEVCKIHRTAMNIGIPKRELITNGYFTKNKEDIEATVNLLAKAGINDLMLSVDAFHQQTIPLDIVKYFAYCVMKSGIPIRLNPAWLVSEEDDNPYNLETRRIVDEFSDMDIYAPHGNIVFPSGNAIEFLKEYFDANKEYLNPYEDNPQDIWSISVNPNGDVLDGNIYRDKIEDIMDKYRLLDK